MGGSIDRMTSGGTQAKIADAGDMGNETAGLQADIRETQERLGDTIEEIGERFNPRRLKEEVKHDIRDATIGRMENMAQQTAETINSAQRSLRAAMRDNPVPVAMIGIGLGWLIWNGSKKGTSSPPQFASTGRSDNYGAGTKGYAGDQDRGTFARAKATASGAVDSMKEKSSRLAEGTQETVERVEASAHELVDFVVDESKIQVGKVESMYQENPLIMGAAILALGLAGGLALPSTRKEAELVGATRDNLVDKALDVAQDTKGKVGEVAERVIHDAQAAASDAAHAVGLMS